ncbi:MAG TPA: hypothetical protein DF383_01220, partial [Deltaproteobacteria bacterium]|nr:hypothetical protein [Deltaproteobacteria bacterium]
QYVNPHIAPDGNYVPGYYRTRGAIPPKLNPNPLYFPIDGRDAPYSGKFPGAQYFNLNPALSPYATEQWPYFTAP